LEAKVCGVYLVKEPGFLTIRASIGHEEKDFVKGLKLPISSGPGTGLTGHVAYTGELFNEHGQGLTSHFAVRKSKVSKKPPRECYSVLAIPLKKLDRVIGVLRVEDKKDENGLPDPNLGFSAEDEWILRIFADAVFVTIENAELLNYKESLVESSPNGIIATDLNRNVLAFNRRAGEILGYKPEDVIRKIPVEKLYYDEREPRKIGSELHKAKELGETRGTTYETAVRSKSGEKIPIRLSPSWLYDAHGNRIGSVGYFEDLRSVKEIEQRLDMFLSVSSGHPATASTPRWRRRGSRSPTARR
jgi:PAS domain S-box-containing protein